MTAPHGPMLLLTPGPTPIHPRAQAALSWPMRGHMDPEVFAYNDAIVADLKLLYGADDGAFASLLAGTGSLGMEAGLANLLEPGDRLLVASNGVFGERMGHMATRLGADTTVLRFVAGDAVDPAAVRRALREVRPKVLAVVHGETSTGVLNPLPDIAEEARRAGVLLSVDAVTTAGMMPFRMHELGVDHAYTGSQKCLSAPPGLAPVVYAARAMEAIAARRTPVVSWYADASEMRGYWEPDGGRRYHHTIPVQLHWATGEAIRAALEEGLPAREQRVRRLGAAITHALEPEGFLPFVPEERRLPTVLALELPPSVDDAAVRGVLRDRYGIAVAGGLGPTAGRIWRLGLMGENARSEHYHLLMRALAEVLGAPAVVGRYEAAARGAAAA